MNTKPALTIVFAVFFPLTAPAVSGQAPKVPQRVDSSTALTTSNAIALAEQGRCKEAVPALKRVMTSTVSAETRKTAGVWGLRCSLTLDDRESVLDFIRPLSKQFSKDPEILFVLVHAYSDLSTREAQQLGREAPESIAAHKLNAEAWETQGKWDDAQREYERIIRAHPEAPGIHFLLGRLLLSRPDADAKAAEQAKEAFQKEIEIDPKNAGAHFVLGELESKEENWEEAVKQFSTATKLDPNFAEAYVGWGFALLTLKRYAEAIPPLRAAERLSPANPAIHYSLGTALTRTGQREEAEKEFAIHRELVATKPAPPGAEKPQ
jgi:tetratricopeptide (TPR) repeat protein